MQVYQDKMDRTNQLMHELSVQKQMIASQTCQLDSMNTKFQQNKTLLTAMVAQTEFDRDEQVEGALKQYDTKDQLNFRTLQGLQPQFSTMVISGGGLAAFNDEQSSVRTTSQGRRRKESHDDDILFKTSPNLASQLKGRTTTQPSSPYNVQQRQQLLFNRVQCASRAELLEKKDGTLVEEDEDTYHSMVEEKKEVQKS